MISRDKEHPVKKFFMVLMWRTQQIGLPTNIAMLAITLALQVNFYISWRFSHTYLGVLITLTGILTVILIAGLIWDTRLRMWHEQNVVMYERNPYNMHKMAAKEIVHMLCLWVPAFLDRGDQKARTLAEGWAAWCEDQMTKDPALRASVDELIRRYFSESGGTTHGGA